MRLTSFVDIATGIVEMPFVPEQRHIGFHGVIHGGVLATVVDEAMVWAATWAGKRFCLAAELTVRYRRPGEVGRSLRVMAKVETSRSRLITTIGRITDGETVIAEATGKYIPIGDAQNAEFVATLVDEAESREAIALLKP